MNKIGYMKILNKEVKSWTKMKELLINNLKEWKINESTMKGEREKDRH